jgi:hypothetical protein
MLGPVAALFESGYCAFFQIGAQRNLFEGDCVLQQLVSGMIMVRVCSMDGAHAAASAVRAPDLLA